MHALEKDGVSAFLPLVQIEIVILLLHFELCEFTPTSCKRSNRLTLFRESQLMVLKLLYIEITICLYEFTPTIM